MRGNDRNGAGTLLMGREGWFDEVMRFYDKHLKDIEPEVVDPAFAIQDNYGAWRAQDTWPVVDNREMVRLQTRSYVDDGLFPLSTTAMEQLDDVQYDMENYSSPQLAAAAQDQFGILADDVTRDNNSYYTWSTPVPQDVRLTGTPNLQFRARVTGNVHVQLFDVAPNNRGVMFDEMMSVVEPGLVSVDLKDTDWTLKEGHRLVVRIGTKDLLNFGWRPVTSNATIVVYSPRLWLDVQDPSNDVATEGAPAPYLGAYKSNYTKVFSTTATGTFDVPLP